MMVALLFWGLVLLCGGFAAGYGGRAGRRIALVYFAACVATSWVTRDDLAWLHPHLSAFGVDLVLLGALGWVALRSDRWFPIWFTGLHLVAVTSHLASIVAPAFSPKVYFLVQAVWSIPMLLTLAIGVALDKRAGISDAAGEAPA
jgi:hypothetical protein